MEAHKKVALSPAPHLSVVIPAFNSHSALDSNLPYLLSHLGTKKYLWEIILVDDGSDDPTALQLIADKYDLVFHRLPRNQGKGEALRKGTQLAQGHYVVFTDSDIPYDCQTIDDMLESLETDLCDLALGSRFHRESSSHIKVPKLRAYGTIFFSKIVHWILPSVEGDTQCGLKAFRRDRIGSIFQETKTQGFAFDVELILLTQNSNRKIKNFPVALRSQDGKSIHILFHGMRMIFAVLKIFLQNRNSRH
ncbi:MAG: glycosyltransferase [Pseudomonadota bacterium]